MQRLFISACRLILLIALVSNLKCSKQPAHQASLNAGDFPSIQAALDALPSNGGLVRIPAGIYRISEPLRIRLSNVALVGEGRGTVIVNQNRQGEPAILARPAKDPEANPLWGVTISNMCITGDTAAIREAGAWPEEDRFLNQGGDGILADHCYNSLFEKLWIVRNRGHGLNLIICYEDPRIQSCVITYNRKSGIRLEGCHDIVVSANQLEENYQEGILAIGCYNLTASGNNIDDHRGPGIVLKSTTCSSLSGNLIEESRGWGLIFQNSHTNTFSAGTIRNNVPGGGARFSNSSFNVISGCTFEANDSLAVYTDIDSRQNNITGNTFSTERYEESTPSSSGLFIAGGENLVSANIISPKTGFGLILSGEAHNVFGNTIISPKGTHCILIENLKNAIIRDNLLLSRLEAGSAGIILKRGSNRGNRLENNR